MLHKGSCHCGKVQFKAEGEFDSVVECNCSHCSRKGYLLWFLPREKLTLHDDDNSLSTYTFNKHAIKHQFCTHCGCAPFGFATHNGVDTVALNVRCLEDIDLASIKRNFVDGRAY